jgi:adenosine deaminase CECR1
VKLLLLALALSFSERFDAIRREATREELYRVLYDLPKGGDLHDHLGGAVFSETWFRLASEGGSYYTRVRMSGCAATCPAPALAFHTVLESTWSRMPSCCQSEYEPLRELDSDQKASWLNAMRLDAEGEGRDEFFEKIWPRLNDIIDQAPIIAEAAVETQKAFAHEGVSYVEFQLSPFERKIGERVLSPEEFSDVLEERLAREDALATGVTVRMQTNVLRFHRDAEKMVQRSWAFVDANRDLWVSVNLVGREDNDKGYPLRFLDTFRAMRRRYPRIGLAIHGGEVDEPNHHVRDTLLLGADRIGHGTNLVTDPETLLLMRSGKFAVEISLVSNRLLGYAEDLSTHPFPELLRLGIPVCISTDDRGMWDSNMTDEWFEAVTRFNLSWEEILELGRNSLKFAFVPQDVKAKLLERYERDIEAFAAKYAEGDWRRQALQVDARPSGYARKHLLVP